MKNALLLTAAAVLLACPLHCPAGGTPAIEARRTAMAGAATGTGKVDRPPAAVDGLFEDWTEIEPAWTDTKGDGSPIDLGRIWVRTDAERATFRFETAHEMNLQSSNALTLLIDGDSDASTGIPSHGLGAELIWTFGARKGRISAGGTEMAVEQADVGMRQAPTVSSTEFEVSFLRTTPDGHPLAPAGEVRIVLSDEGRDGGDRLPDAGALAIAAPPDPAPAGPAVDLARRSPDDIRVLTWNVLFDGLFKRPAQFFRVLRAIDPDVICFQEIWSHTALHTTEQVSLALPDATWHGESTNEGLIVSRYPLIDARPIDDAGNYWALVDLPDERYDVDLSIVSAHPPCCEKEAERQAELDGIAAWVRDLSRGGDPSVPDGTPIVIAGDMNLVGGSRQLRTLLYGSIVDEAAHGASLPLDWDGTGLTDARPRHAGGFDVFTWRGSRSSFAPGQLDYIVYTDSVLRLSNAFVLATEELPESELLKHGLRAADTLEASDHLPVVADFTPLYGQAQRETTE